VAKIFQDKDYGDTHAAFQQWRRHNPEGYFLNLKSSRNAMLHRTLCPHTGDTEWGHGEEGYGSLTRSKKICSENSRELEEWAAKNVAESLKKCRDCSL